MSESLDAELDRIFAARDRDAMAPTIAALEEIHARHPDHARVLYELAGAHDTAGDERGLGSVSRALDAGLTRHPPPMPAPVRQHAAKPRPVRRVLRVFADARDEFPEAVSLAVFEALSLHAAGQVHAAFAELLDVVAAHASETELDRYRASLRANADYLRDLDVAADGGA
jgi:thioredoxin-like negative regulator of GroEL